MFIVWNTAVRIPGPRNAGETGIYSMSGIFSLLVLTLKWV